MKFGFFGSSAEQSCFKFCCAVLSGVVLCYIAFCCVCCVVFCRVVFDCVKLGSFVLRNVP